MFIYKFNFKFQTLICILNGALQISEFGHKTMIILQKFSNFSDFNDSTKHHVPM